MRKLPLYVLIAGFAALPTTHAQGLEGLEMDVMGAGESPGEATARIALPGPRTAVREDTPEDAASVAAQTQRAGESAALEAAEHATRELATDSPVETDAPAAPDSAVGAVDVGQGFDVGEPTGVDDGGGFIGGEPIDPGVIDGGPGDVGIIEPGGGVDELPVEEPPLGEPPVDGPPVTEPPVDESPTGEIPIGEDGGVVPGDEGGTDAGGGGADGGGGDEVSIQPLPVESSDGSAQHAVEVR